MERGYSSVLTKNALAYNLAYHLKDKCGLDNAHEVVISVLNSFEYKESNNNDDKNNLKIK
jgi:hypothetical protein